MGSIANYGSTRTEDLIDSRFVLAQAMRTIKGLNAELDRTRAERDHLRALVIGSQGKEQLISGVV